MEKPKCPRCYYVAYPRCEVTEETRDYYCCRCGEFVGFLPRSSGSTFMSSEPLQQKVKEDKLYLLVRVTYPNDCISVDNDWNEAHFGLRVLSKAGIVARIEERGK